MISIRYPLNFKQLIFKFVVLSIALLSYKLNAAPADGVVYWSSVDKHENISLSEDNLTMIVTNPDSWDMMYAVRSNLPISAGDGFFYFEFEQVTESPHWQQGAALGVTTAEALLSGSETTLLYDAIDSLEAALCGGCNGVTGIVVDYRGDNPIVHLFTEVEGDNINSSSVTMDIDSADLYIYAAANHNSMFRINFGGIEGSLFRGNPEDLIESIMFNGGDLLEYGMPIERNPPSIVINENHQLINLGSPVTYTAQATDADNVDISAEVRWYVDGVFSTAGSSFSPDSSVVGSYIISAEVTDNAELFTRSSADLHVFPTVGGDFLDHDHDGLSYTEEMLAGTDPAEHDTDGDGLSDGYEVGNSNDPLDANDPASLLVTKHESNVFFNFEPGATYGNVSVSDDGLSVGYMTSLYTANGKSAIRANQGMKGDFRYWEGEFFFDTSMGMGFIGPDAKINDYCCVSSSLSNTEPSMSVNALGNNSIWRNLVNQNASFPEDTDYVGLAADYRGAYPVVYVIGVSGVMTTLTLDDYDSSQALFPMFYGNGWVPDRGNDVVLQEANFGHQPFFYNVVQALQNEGVDTSDFMPGWGKHRQRQHLELSVTSLASTVGATETISATASDADGVDSSSDITWSVFNDLYEDVTSSVATSPFTASSIDIVFNQAADFTIIASMNDSKTGKVFSRKISATAAPFPGDTTAPTISNVPANLTVIISRGSEVSASIADIQGFLSEPVPADETSFVTIANDAPVSFPLGSTTVTFTAKDGANNTTNATAVVTVVSSDVTDPIVIAPDDLELDLSSGVTMPATNPEIAAFLSGATATDNVDLNIMAIASSATGAGTSLVEFQPGITEVTFIATDDAGNQASATATITVKLPPPPNITANRSSTVTSFADQAGLETVLSFTIESDSSDAQINSFRLSASGELDEVTEVASVRLYRDGMELQSSNYLTDNGQIIFTFTVPLILNVGSNQFSVAYEF